ncbi:MAG: hypothetical protein WAL50_22935 [Kineosporiaceae bacterium]
MERYWFNTTTGKVEADADKSRGEVLMGPYPTFEEAARALQTARERTEKWDEEDRRWSEGEGGGAAGPDRRA